MSLTPNIRIEFECAICGTDCVDIMDRVAKRHPKDSICQVCEEQCDEQAEAAVIGLMVDSVTGQCQTMPHSAAQCRTVPDPYARTTTCWVHEYRPPTHRVSTRWSMLVIGLITIAVGVAAANLVVG